MRVLHARLRRRRDPISSIRFPTPHRTRFARPSRGTSAAAPDTGPSSDRWKASQGTADDHHRRTDGSRSAGAASANRSSDRTASRNSPATSPTPPISTTTGCLWGATVRSLHAHARITRLDVTPALAMAGVQAALTQDDVPGRAMYGLEHVDQPVLADGVARYWGQPIALVAADDPETARAAAAAVVVEYEVLDPLTDPKRPRSRRGLPTSQDSARRSGPPRRGRRRGLLRDGVPGSGAAGDRSRSGDPGRTRRGGSLRGQPVDPRRPRAGLRPASASLPTRFAAIPPGSEELSALART